MVITEANDAYKGGLVEDRTMYIPADQLESDDWAGTLVHEFTHFEEGSREYAIMADFLQSDGIVVDDGEGGKISLLDKAEASVLAKEYGITAENLNEIIAKQENGEYLTDDERRIVSDFTSEVVAHETEIVLGNEEFVDRIIAEYGSAAERLVSRILKLDKGLSSMKDKQARAQAKLIKQAEKLYLKAAESAGNKRIMKMILAQRPELEEELTGMNEEKTHIHLEKEFSEYPYNMQTVIKEYIDSVDDSLVDFRNDAMSETNKKRLEYMHHDFTNDLPENVMNNISQIVGFDVTDFGITINGEGVRHIDRMHGKNGKHDHSMQEEKDVARMQYVISNADKAEVTINSSGEIVKDHQYRNTDNTESSVVSITKKINGTYYVVCVVPDSKAKKMRVKSAYISKKEVNQEFDASTAPNATSETNLDITSNNSISHSAEKSTENTKKVSGNEKNVQLDRKIRKLSQNDLADYLKAGGRRNKSKTEAIEQGKNIILSSDEEISSFIKSAIAGNRDLPTSAYGKVSDYLAKDVEEYSDGDIDIKGNYLEFVPDDIHHAYNGHSQAKEEGDFALTKEDFEKIPEYIETYDDIVYAIRFSNGNTRVCISKKTDDGRVLLIQTVSKSRGSLNFKNMIGVSEEKYVLEYEQKYKKRSIPNSRGSESSNISLRDGTASNNSISDSSEKSNSFDKKTLENISRDEKNVQLSLKSSEDTVNISKGELAKIKANYKSDKVFDKNNVTKAINSIEYIAGIRPQLRNELINRVWKGYNERLDMAGYEKFTEVMYHRIHATILQETSFEMNDSDIVKMDEQIAQALVKIVESGKPSEKAKLESATSTEGYRKQAEYWRNEHIQANERRSIEGRIMQLTDKVKNIKKGAYLNASQYNWNIKHYYGKDSSPFFFN